MKRKAWGRKAPRTAQHLLSCTECGPLHVATYIEIITHHGDDATTVLFERVRPLCAPCLLYSAKMYAKYAPNVKMTVAPL